MELNPLELMRGPVGRTMAIVASATAFYASTAEARVINHSSAVTPKATSNFLGYTSLTPDSLTSSVIDSVIPAPDNQNVVPETGSLTDTSFNAVGLCVPSDPNFSTTIGSYNVSAAETDSTMCNGSPGPQPGPNELSALPATLESQANLFESALGITGRVFHDPNNPTVPSTVSFFGVTNKGSAVNPGQYPQSTAQFDLNCPPATDGTAANYDSSVVVNMQGGVNENFCKVQGVAAPDATPTFSAPASAKPGTVQFNINVPGKFDSGTVDVVNVSPYLIGVQGSQPKTTISTVPGSRGSWSLPGSAAGGSTKETISYQMLPTAPNNSQVCADILVQTTEANSGSTRHDTTQDQECVTKLPAPTTGPAHPGTQGPLQPWRVAGTLSSYFVKRNELAADPKHPVDPMQPVEQKVSAHTMERRGNCSTDPFNPAFRYMLDKPSSLLLVMCAKASNGQFKSIFHRRSAFIGVNPPLAHPSNYQPTMNSVGNQAGNSVHVSKAHRGSVKFIDSTNTHTEIDFNKRTGKHHGRLLKWLKLSQHGNTVAAQEGWYR